MIPPGLIPPSVAQLGDAVQGLLDRHLLQHGDEVHDGLRRADDLLHGVGVPADRPDPGQVGYLAGDVQEPADPAGRRGVHHDGVVDAAALVVLAPDGLGGLAGEQHVAQAGRDGGGEVHHAELGQRGARVAQAVEHLEVLDQGRLGVGHQGEDVAALVSLRAEADRDPALGVGQRRHVEQLGDALTALDLHEQHLPAIGGEGQGQRAGHGGLARAALAGDHVQPYAVPVGVTRSHDWRLSGRAEQVAHVPGRCRGRAGVLAGRRDERLARHVRYLPALGAQRECH